MTRGWLHANPADRDRATIKAHPEDFRVVEQSAFEPEGTGEHLYLRIEKTGLSTPEVARWLSARFQVPEVAVGYAGMKDKRAVTEQWFSVHTPAEAAELTPPPGVRLCAATRHRCKLRRGELAGNRFCIRLRDVSGARCECRLAALAERGAPNYFGPQRFGGDNLARARDWLAQGGRRRRRRSRAGERRAFGAGEGHEFRAGLYLSVLRSFLFNEVLALRVAEGTWDRLLPGDVAASAAQEDAGRPTGPLWGRGRSLAADQALAVEQAALAPHGELCHALEHTGLEQQRRSLVLLPRDLAWQRDGDELSLRFVLPPGAYATTLLDSVFDLVTPEAR